MKNLIKWCGIILTMFPTFCFSQSLSEFEIGNVIDKKYISDSSNNFILTHPSQIRPYIEITIDSIDYVVAYDDKTFKIKYIFTEDKNFATSEGLKVGSEISLRKEDVIIYPGWNVYSKSSDNLWNPIVGHNYYKDGDTTRFISKDTFKNQSVVTFKILGFSKGAN